MLLKSQRLASSILENPRPAPQSLFSHLSFIFQAKTLSITSTMDILELVHDDYRLEHRPFQCAFAGCSKAFARRSDLVRHARIHNDDRPYSCPIASCGKSFIQKSACMVHIRTHTGEKPHVCDTCNKAFSDSSSLARHRRVHFGRRPYRCLVDGCGKAFCRKTTLTKHSRRSHSALLSEEALKLKRKEKVSDASFDSAFPISPSALAMQARTGIARDTTFGASSILPALTNGFESSGSSDSTVTSPGGAFSTDSPFSSLPGSPYSAHSTAGFDNVHVSLLSSFSPSTTMPMLKPQLTPNHLSLSMSGMHAGLGAHAGPMSWPYDPLPPVINATACDFERYTHNRPSHSGSHRSYYRNAMFRHTE
ncbi:hypothetical protein K437DRAFT_131899 [Tilletiaria anomala UBC 951]|uniref:C2H2-type domain-containing protein n=1 Tax=Tilletiaria anomala (strain ATCC 24038 / CBS 436.72 / UBC 951) TaxID=1037660 RepID=A0A066WK20_TILAU|nr:uncharacterized protein K437DRAFT_131899 [Tilletiaria anomala UBC 951]KDN52908.1 hypothetical protein K437DRAFT_131899 [Tilletiaria anomala UBC 951]